MLHSVKSICLRNFDSVPKDHKLGVYVYYVDSAISILGFCHVSDA